MSAKVFWGLNKTPTIRATGPREAGVSGAGLGATVVAIEDSSTTRLGNASDCKYVQGRGNISADSTADTQGLTLISDEKKGAEEPLTIGERNDEFQRGMRGRKAN